MIKISFPDGSSKQFKEGITGLDIAKSIGERLARAALAIKVNGITTDLTTPINKSSKVQILTFKDPEGIDAFRHSSAHILAHAVKNLYPKAQNTIGPAVEDGFYYDFDNLDIKPEDFPKVEAEMNKIIKENLPFEKVDWKLADVKNHFPKNKFKLELAEEFSKEGQTLTAYKDGDFIDLCEGPHIPSTGKIKAIKLMKMSGAYWRGDQKNKQLTRIYGISFPDKKLMKEYLTLLEEAKKRDHRKLGRELNLYSFHEEAPGMPFFHDKGAYIWDKLVEYTTSVMRKRNYQLVKTPLILNNELWKKSGHWNHYKENMYFTKIDEQDFAIKPMNCPGHILIYKTHSHSYREFPLKMGEFGLVHRHELSGVLSGLFRVRCFTQDDAHIFCTEDQMEDQLIELLDLTDEVYKTFGFEYHLELSTRPEKAMGDKKIWDRAEKTLKNAMEKKGLKFTINEGDGAFYGPKIDCHLKDALGRTWQCGTIQLDFQMPEKFDLTYEASDSRKHHPVVIHRTILGSVERFMGILVEHYAGKFPMWISPEQIRILSVADRFAKDASKLVQKLKDAGLRATLDETAESIPKKVRKAQLDQVNYILVFGEKEQSGELNVRTRDNKVHPPTKVNDFVKKCLKEIEERK
jgi:threonyl-tRNA synthetase